MKTELLALNIIVGPGDLDNLKNLLGHCDARKVFDSIIIVGTYGDDKQLKLLCDEYDATLLYHEWKSDRYPHGNFAAARNVALSNTKSDYVMWLDCDDIPPTPAEMFEIRRVLVDKKRDFYLMPYYINRDENGIYTMVFKRERIFKNDSSIAWEYACHEQIDVSRFSTFGDIENCGIRHGSDKSPIIGIERNLAIQEHELKYTDSVHVRFNYAKDLIFKNNFDYSIDREKKALDILESIVSKHELSEDNLSMICSLIAQTYAYKPNSNGTNKTLQEKNRKQAEHFSHLCISFGDHMAEPYVILGDFLFMSGELKRCIPLYKNAISKKPSGISVSNLSFYDDIPSYRLSKVYHELKDIELALHYNRRALRYSPKSKDLIDDRASMIKELVEEICPTHS